MKRLITLKVLVVSLLVVASSPTIAQFEHPFQDPNLPMEQRIENLLSLMTLDEKIECLSTRPDVPRLGVKGSGHVEGLHGLAQGGPGNWGRDNPIPTTTFTQAIGMGHTWDTTIIKEAAALQAYEMRYLFQNADFQRGGLVLRAPIPDLGRDPRWGRTEECYGEDPYLSGVLTSAFIQGLQGDHPKYWRAASLLKHFLANSNENGRLHTSSDFDQRLLHEYYGAAFRRAITVGGASSYMAAYNAYNGIPCTVHPIIRDLTIDEWGADGIICTDAGALRFLVSEHKYYPDLKMAAAECLRAGINQFLDKYRDPIRGALDEGLLSEAEIDRELKGVFRTMIRLGLLDPPELVPYSNIGAEDDIVPWERQSHKDFARLITQKSITLLKNEGNMLPLSRDEIESIAIIGPRANEVLLDWYSGTPPYTVSPYSGLKLNAPNVKIELALDNQGDAAVELARNSDIVIMCVGNHPYCDAGWEQCPVESEGKEAMDRRTIYLEQEELIKEVYRANPNMVVVLISSFPYAISWTDQHVPAILHMAQNSQELGNALADAIFGDINPAGRLVQTWPRTLEQLPPMMDYNIRNGRTYMYFKGDPLYPFGYGLSYTNFEYSNMTVSSNTMSKDGSIRVEVDVKNTGHVAGDEVVQLYIRHINSSVERPKKELKGFNRISIAPQDKMRVEFTLPASELAYWDIGLQQFVVEKGMIELQIGPSSATVHASERIIIE